MLGDPGLCTCCFVLRPAPGLSQLSRQLLTFVIVCGFEVCCCWLWSFCVYVWRGQHLFSIYQEFEDFFEIEDMEFVDFGGWALVIATVLVLDIYKVCTKFLRFLL